MRSWLRWPGRGPAPPSAPPAPPLPDPGHRIYAVGDVHGRHDLLEMLLWTLKQDAAAQEDERLPILVFLGDLIDRGDHSRKVLDQVMDAWLSWPRTVCLRGNHEDALLGFLDAPETGRSWLGFGGKQTLGSYGVPAPSSQASASELFGTALALSGALGHHGDFLRRSELLFRSGDVVFSHAGLDRSVP
ncbi:MAG: metallophosphoesterase, partial [Pseudomonadota bacterium]